MSNIINLKSNEEWDILYKSNKKLAVDFTASWCSSCQIITASWCSSCQMITPLFEELSNKFKEIYFIKIDVDDFEEIVQDMGVTCMPTFYFIFNEKIIKKMTGTNELELKKNILLLNEYLDNSSDSFSPEDKTNNL